jgi:hypothetical protein
LLQPETHLLQPETHLLQPEPNELRNASSTQSIEKRKFGAANSETQVRRSQFRNEVRRKSITGRDRKFRRDSNEVRLMDYFAPFANASSTQSGTDALVFADSQTAFLPDFDNKTTSVAVEWAYNRPHYLIKTGMMYDAGKSGVYEVFYTPATSNHDNHINHINHSSDKMNCFVMLANASSTQSGTTGTKSPKDLNMDNPLQAEGAARGSENESAARRSKDEVRRSKDEVRRSKDEARRSKDEVRRSKDEARRSKDEVREIEGAVRGIKDEAIHFWTSCAIFAASGNSQFSILNSQFSIRNRSQFETSINK